MSTLRAVKAGRISLDTLLTVSPNAAAQAPTKMGFKPGSQITVDNALKMLMVKSANDMAVVLAEGVSGSIEAFADEMNAARRAARHDADHLCQSERTAGRRTDHLGARPGDPRARDLSTNSRNTSCYWNISAIKFGKRIMRNYNSLLGRYPGDRRHEDRLHLRVGLQRGGVGQAQRPAADRRRAGRAVRAVCAPSRSRRCWSAASRPAASPG